MSPTSTQFVPRAEWSCKEFAQFVGIAPETLQRPKYWRRYGGNKSVQETATDCANLVRRLAPKFMTQGAGGMPGERLRRGPISTAQLAQLKRLRARGLSFAAISERTGIPTSSVRRALL